MKNMNKEQKLKKHFVIGSIVKSYGNGLDKVLNFDWNNGDWKVTVQAINKDGSIDKNYPNPRTHSTLPNNL